MKKKLPSEETIDTLLGSNFVQPKRNRVDYVKSVYLRVTPIFDAEMGRRLQIIRMRHFMDQKEFAEFLGIAQGTLSKIERGMLPTAQYPFSVAKLQEIAGDALLYILIGTNSERWEAGKYSTNYWTERFKRREARRKAKLNNQNG